MNKHILLVMKWLNDKESVTQEELKDNAADAAAADAAYADAADAAAYAYAAAYDAAYDAADAAAYAYAAAYDEKWINKYFDQTGENKQDYTDALAAKVEPPVFTQAMADNGVLPSVGMEYLDEDGQLCEAIANYSNFVVGVQTEHLIQQYPSVSVSRNDRVKPLTPPITLIDKALNDMVEQLTNEGIVTYDPIMLRILIEKFKNNKISGIKWTDNE